MTRKLDSTQVELAMQLLSNNGLDAMAEAVRLLLNESMKIERAQALGAEPYQRTEDRNGYSNGFKPKTVDTRLGPIQFAIPQVRGDAEFYPSALERGLRSERALKVAIAEMYIQGVSTRKVAAVMKKLCGLDVTSMEVSRATALLDHQFEAWRTRPLGQTPYLLLDARYEKVRHGDSVISSATLIATGITADGRREILGVSVSLSEAEVHWRDFLASLQERGMHGVKMITSDSHAGLKAALDTRFPGVPWQRCQFHLQQNAAAYVPRIDMRKQVARDIRAIFDAPNREEADRLVQLTVKKYSSTAPRLAQWIETNIPQGLTVFALPQEHRKRLRTTNMNAPHQQRSQTTHARRRNLPKRSITAAARHRAAHRNQRRMAIASHLHQHEFERLYLTKISNWKIY